MSVRRLLTQTVTVRRPDQTTDAEGNVTSTWAATTHNGRVEPASTFEVADDRVVTTSEWRLFLPPDVDVSSDDQVDADGQRFDVVGRAAVMRTPRGPHHVEVRLRIVEA